MGQPDPIRRPTIQAERTVSIDVLRGFALLGILAVNIQSFAMIDAAYFNPTAYGDLSGANGMVWLTTHLFFDQKFMTIFSMLFGAGIVMMAGRLEQRGVRPAPVHYFRMLWLIVLGLMHGHLLWFGDILYLYGVCGLAVYLFRKLSPRWLIPLGLVSISVASVLFLLFGWSMQFWPEAQLQDFARDWQPAPEAIEEELATYRSGWWTQMHHRVPTALEFELFVLVIWGAWRAGGLMLVGMGLYKLGMFSARRSPAAYRAIAGLGLFVGVPLVSYGVVRQFEENWRADWSFFFGTQFNYWGSLLVSFAFVAMVMLACQRSMAAWPQRSLAAVGQMALSNYLLHTVICTTLFYGHGLGLFGRVGRTGQAAIVIVIWILQLVVSPIWLRRFRFGPMEWVWRSLTYRKLQPFRR